MKISEFEKELQLINKDLAIRPNNPPKRVLDAYPELIKISTITYQGADICTIPSDEIYDERNGNYGVDLRGDGSFVPHRSRLEALAIIKDKLKMLENKDEAEAFFGRGEYSDEALSRKDIPQVTVVEEVKIEPKQIQGGMIEDSK